MKINGIGETHTHTVKQSGSPQIKSMFCQLIFDTAQGVVAFCLIKSEVNSRLDWMLGPIQHPSSRTPIKGLIEKLWCSYCSFFKTTSWELVLKFFASESKDIFHKRCL